MRKLIFRFYRGFLALFIILILSCGSQRGATEVEKAYRRFSSAILSNQEEILREVAPIFTDKKNEPALEKLRAILRESPSYKVRILDANNAEVVLAGPSPLVIPFTKDLSGRWLVEDRIVRTRFIEFLPAK